jgi:HD-GYP domain-containing protein (c-di-GMP phosphodiesterase class II)
MRKAVPLATLASVGATASAALAASGSNPHVIDLVVLGTALTIGLVIELRPTDRSPLPFGLAITVVLVRAASPDEFVAIVAGASLAAVILKAHPRGLAPKVLVLSELLAMGLGAGAAYQVVLTFGGSTSRVAVLVGLAVAAAIQIVVADLVTAVRDHRVAPIRARSVDIALITSGILMAVGYGGIDGRGKLGLWGPALFSIPLLATWFSLELVARTRRTFRQTVEALGIAPELGGLVRAGHVKRVAELSVQIGQHLGIDDNQLEDLETAAWLHHLGAVCLDDPPEGHGLDPSSVAQAGAEMLRASRALSRAGDVVGSEPSLHRSPEAQANHGSELLGQILKVASAYDELTEGNDEHAEWAVEALFTGPAYVFDGRVLTALEEVLLDRGVLAG